MSSGIESDLDFIYDPNFSHAPWHSMGKTASPIDEAALLATNIISDVSTEMVFRMSNGEYVPVTDHVAVTKQGTCLSIMGADYKPHQASEVYRTTVKPSCEAHDLPLATAGNLFRGKRFFFSAKIPAGTFNLFGIGEQEAHALWASSFDGTLPSINMLTVVNTVCANTLNLAVGSGGHKASGKMGIRQRHRSILDPARFNDWLTNALVSVEDYHAEADRLRACSRFPLEAECFLAETMQPALFDVIDLPTQREKVLAVLSSDKTANLFRLELAENGKTTVKKLISETLPLQAGGDDGTLWGTFNAVSYFTDHQQGRTLGARMNKQLFGLGSDMKSAAWHRACDYASSLH